MNSKKWRSLGAFKGVQLSLKTCRLLNKKKVIIYNNKWNTNFSWGSGRALNKICEPQLLPKDLAVLDNNSANPGT